MQVLAQWDERANNGAQVENSPENCDILALGLLGRVGQHDGALSGPEQTSAGTQQGAREDQEPGVLGVVVAENRRDVEAVAEAAEAECQTQSDRVGDAASEEADDGESRVDGGAGVVDVVGVDLASGAEAVDGIEHARAQEADQRDKDDLELWCCVGGERDRS